MSSAKSYTIPQVQELYRTKEGGYGFEARLHTPATNHDLSQVKEFLSRAGHKDVIVRFGRPVQALTGTDNTKIYCQGIGPIPYWKVWAHIARAIRRFRFRAIFKTRRA